MFLEGLLISLSVLLELIVLNVYLRVLLFLHDRKIKRASRPGMRTGTPYDPDRQTGWKHRDPQ